MDDTTYQMDNRTYKPGYRCKICDRLILDSRHTVGIGTARGILAAIERKDTKNITIPMHKACDSDEHMGLAEFVGFYKDRRDY